MTTTAEVHEIAGVRIVMTEEAWHSRRRALAEHAARCTRIVAECRLCSEHMGMERSS